MISPKPERPRLLSRAASRRLVVLGAVLVLVLSALTAYVLIWSVQDPELQQHLEEARDAARSDAAADTAPADTTAPTPRP